MIFRLDPTFERQLRRLPLDRQVEVLLACLRIPASLAVPTQHSGLGLRKIHPKGYWEIRAGLDLRVVFRLEKNQSTLLMVGSHDQVRRYVREI